MGPLLKSEVDGHLYCSMRGHSERGCTGGEDHMELVREGVGFSSAPGPSDAELREETRNDRELMLDEFHGRDL